MAAPAFNITTQYPRHSNEDMAQGVFKELINIAQNGLHSGYDSMDDYYFDMWPGFSWNDKSLVQIQMVLAHPELPAVDQTIHARYGVLVSDELRKGEKSRLEYNKPKESAAPLVLEPFCDHDWMAYCGAESFSDGSPPLIGMAKFTDTPFGAVDVVVILDANRLSMIFDHPNLLDINFTGMTAARALTKLKSVMKLDDLLTLPGWPY